MDKRVFEKNIMAETSDPVCSDVPHWSTLVDEGKG